MFDDFIAGYRQVDTSSAKYGSVYDDDETTSEVRSPEESMVCKKPVINDLVAVKVLGDIYVEGSAENRPQASSRHVERKACVVETGSQKFVCAPRCLLHGSGDVLLPLVIQITPAHGERSPVYTWKDNEGTFSDWTMAKLWVRMAEANSLLYEARILTAHLLTEPVAIAVERNIPSIHPLHSLLVPHLRHVIAVNAIYRQHVLSEGGALEEVGIG